MFRRGPSVLFAALLLVAQLLLGVMAPGAAAHAGTQDCGGCPDGHASSMTHDPGSRGDCGSHCSGDDAPVTHTQGCGADCLMAGSSHCGYSANPAVNVATSLVPEVTSASFGADRRSVHLPDSPLFDLLRPPTRA